MSEHHDPLEALRHVAEFLDLLADQAKATSQAIHDAIPDQVDLAAADLLDLLSDQAKVTSQAVYDASADHPSRAPRPVSPSPRPLKSPQAGDFGEGRKD